MLCCGEAEERKERSGCGAWLPVAMPFASCRGVRLRRPGLSRGLSKASLWSGKRCAQRSQDLPLQSRYARSRESPGGTNGSEGRRSGTPAAMESILAAHWKTSPGAAITEDDAFALRANRDALGSQAKYWRPL